MPDVSMLGAVPSPDDARDYQFVSLLTPDQQAVELPKSFVAQPIPPNLSQQGGTCVGFSSTSMRLAQQRRDLGVWIPLDPYNLYQEAKKRDGLPEGTEGSTVRASMAALKSYGQKTTQVGGGAPWKNKIGAYYRVDVSSQDTIKRSIFTYGGIVIAVRWFDEWFKPNAAGVLPAPSKEAGGHAVYAIGYDSVRGLLLRNSWGRQWGHLGNCWIGWKYVLDKDILWEAWKAVDLPKN